MIRGSADSAAAVPGRSVAPYAPRRIGHRGISMPGFGMAFVLPEDYGYVDQEEVEAEKAAAT